MSKDDKKSKPSTGDEIADFERQVRKLVKKRAKKDADFAVLKENMDERLPYATRHRTFRTVAAGISG